MTCKPASTQSIVVCLEEFRRLQRSEEGLFVLRFGFLGMQGIEDVILEEFLVTHSNFDGLPWGTVFEIPLFDEGDVLCADHVTGTFIERMRSPP